MQPSTMAVRQIRVLARGGRLVIGVLLSSLLVTACSGTAPSGTPSISPSGASDSLLGPSSPSSVGDELGWQRLPKPPLSPRYDALGVYVDGLVLVLGGSNTTISGGPYRPPQLRDGAALDLSTRTWRPIATAPWAPAESAAHAVVGDRVLLARNGPGAWLAYDSADDTWSSARAPLAGRAIHPLQPRGSLSTRAHDLLARWVPTSVNPRGLRCGDDGVLGELAPGLRLMAHRKVTWVRMVTIATRLDELTT